MPKCFAPTLFALCLATTNGYAQESDQEFVERGVELRKQHRDGEALEQFRRAEAIKPTPKIKAQIALAEQAMGKWVEAERDLTSALRASDDGWISNHVAALQDSLAEVRQHLGTLVVRANVQEAELWLNGERIGELPLERLRVPAGTLLVELRTKDHEPVRHSLLLEPEATLTTEIVIAPESDPPVASAESSAKTSESRPTHPNLQRTAAWTALGASGVFLGGALFAQLVGYQQAARYNDNNLCAVPGRTRDEACAIYRGRAETAQSVANLGYIASGSLAAASAILFLVKDGGKPNRHARSRLWLVPNESGADLVGEW
jgi:hypothetical protein